MDLRGIKRDIKPTRLLYTPNPTFIEQKSMKKINPLNSFISVKCPMKFEDGTKVKIIPHIWWPDGGTGKVSLAPTYVNDVIGDDEAFESKQRNMKVVDRIITSGWVKFDKPILDSDGDGPYVSGEVELEYLEHLA